MGRTPTVEQARTDEPEVSATTNTVLKAITVIAILAMVGFWAWIFAGGPQRANPDRLDDRAFAQRTASRCTTMRGQLDRLTPASDSRTPADRAAVVDQATALIARMVDGIQADAPTQGADLRRTRGWIADWRTYLVDRADYARRLRRDARAQLLFDVNKAGDSIDAPIKNFADINDIPACDPPGDIG